MRERVSDEVLNYYTTFPGGIGDMARELLALRSQQAGMVSMPRINTSIEELRRVRNTCVGKDYVQISTMFLNMLCTFAIDYEVIFAAPRRPEKEHPVLARKINSDLMERRREAAEQAAQNADAQEAESATTGSPLSSGQSNPAASAPDQPNLNYAEMLVRSGSHQPGTEQPKFADTNDQLSSLIHQIQQVCNAAGLDPSDWIAEPLYDAAPEQPEHAAQNAAPQATTEAHRQGIPPKQQDVECASPAKGSMPAASAHIQQTDEQGRSMTYWGGIKKEDVEQCVQYEPAAQEQLVEATRNLAHSQQVQVQSGSHQLADLCETVARLGSYQQCSETLFTAAAALRRSGEADALLLQLQQLLIAGIAGSRLWAINKITNYFSAKERG